MILIMYIINMYVLKDNDCNDKNNKIVMIKI